MACNLNSDACRREHIAARLDGVEPDGTDFEARCPECGHGGFRVSRPKRARNLRNIWTCSCKRCNRGRGCGTSITRVAMLRRDIDAGCLGTYDGNASIEISQEVAKAMDTTINDILSVPGLKPAEIRMALAEAQGRKIPTEFGEGVKFAKSIGISKTQAQEIAAVWCRPAACPPLPGGGVADAGHNTDAGVDVKPGSSEARTRSDSDHQPVSIGPTGITDTSRSAGPTPQNVQSSESDQRTLNDKSHLPPAA